MTTKRDIEARLEAIEERRTDDERMEWLIGPMMWFESEPRITDYLASRGFVVERGERHHDTGASDVRIQTTPPAADVLLGILWHYPGPTAPRDAVRIHWEDSRREQVVAEAEHPVEYSQPEPPADPVVVAEGDGWRAVAPEECVVEHLVCRRSAAAKTDHEILGSVPSAIEDADEYDLVEVDADPDAGCRPDTP